MMKAILLFAGAFALCAGLGSASAGCYGTDCDCPDAPDLPPVKPAKLAKLIGADPTPDAAPEGTLEVKGSSVVIRYVERGANIEVVYSVDPLPY
jgi:hypothetical protein